MVNWYQINIVWWDRHLSSFYILRWTFAPHLHRFALCLCSPLSQQVGAALRESFIVEEQNPPKTECNSNLLLILKLQSVSATPGATDIKDPSSLITQYARLKISQCHSPPAARWKTAESCWWRRERVRGGPSGRKCSESEEGDTGDEGSRDKIRKFWLHVCFPLLSSDTLNPIQTQVIAKQRKIGPFI